MSKREMSKRLAGLSFSEKIKILEKLRDRSLALAMVRVSLGGGANDPTPDRDRERLQHEVQKYLSAHLKSTAPNASRSALCALLSAWLVGRGRRVRFEFDVDGKAKSKEVTAVEELDGLIGHDQ